MSEKAIDPIFCGKCGISPEPAFERDGDVWVRCPQCGQEDTLENVKGEAATYKFDTLFRRVFSNLKVDELTARSRPPREYRWIVDD